MFKILTLIGIIFSGNIFCSATESGCSSLEGDIDGAMQHLTIVQVPTEKLATKLEYIKIFWETARATYNAYNINNDEEVAKQKNFLQQKFEEMQLTLGGMPSLTLQSMDKQMESFTAYKYYKNAYIAENKLLKASSKES